MQKIFIPDVSQFNDVEKELILKVLQRDDELKKKHEAKLQ